MNILKAILCILGGIAAAAGVTILAVAHELGEYVKDIFDDDMYWGGKE